MWINWNRQTLYMGLKKGAPPMENSLEILWKAKHGFKIWPSNFTPKYIPKRIEKFCMSGKKPIHKSLFVFWDIHSISEGEIVKMLTN